MLLNPFIDHSSSSLPSLPLNYSHIHIFSKFKLEIYLMSIILNNHYKNNDLI